MFYLGGYYLVKLKEGDFKSVPTRKVFTCSDCINDSLFDVWSLPWTKTRTVDLKDAFENFSLTTEKIERIQSWADKKFNSGKIGWLGVFADLQTAQEYRDSFFDKSDENIKILVIYFSENEREEFLKDFKPEIKDESFIGLGENLLKQIQENEEGKTIGYDLIGVEYSGDFHTFHCHNMAEDLKTKFDLQYLRQKIFEKLK